MYDCRKFFIDGAWVSPAGRRELDVINPATEQPIGKILLGTAEDVDTAVKAARAAFETFSQTSREERVALLEKIVDGLQGAHEGRRSRDLRRDGCADAAGAERAGRAAASAIC